MAQRHHEIERRAGPLGDLGVRNLDLHAFGIVALGIFIPCLAAGVDTLARGQRRLPRNGNQR
ncbi:MAG: hypothetical protein OXC29_17595 [Rhodococcus sp.]|nr:hypothetical protein [Rhodococcus sp. (in: high G+C Gram-positive bacteria)]